MWNKISVYSEIKTVGIAKNVMTLMAKSLLNSAWNAYPVPLQTCKIENIVAIGKFF